MINNHKKVVLEYKVKARLGEGAFWNHKTQELYWVDIEDQLLNIYNPQTKKNRSLPTPSKIGTVVPKNTNETIVALQDGIYTMNLKSGDIVLLSDIESGLTENRFN